MTRTGRLSRTEALATYCGTCGAGAGDPCLYIASEGLTRANSHSPRVLAARAQVGRPTRVLHTARHRSSYWRLRRWLRANADIFDLT